MRSSGPQSTESASSARRSRRRASEALPELAALVVGGELTVQVWRTYPLAQATRAHANLQARRNHGMIILLP